MTLWRDFRSDGVEIVQVTFAHEGGGRPKTVCDGCLATRDRDGRMEHAEKCPGAMAAGGRLMSDVDGKVAIMDLSIGSQIGRWTIVGLIQVSKRSRVECKCECGVARSVMVQTLKSGGSKSCGCLARERCRLRSGIKASNASHLMSKTPTYRAWKSIKERCLNVKSRSYPGWGGRGITMCQRWRESFEAFLEDMGERPENKWSIDRIDNDLLIDSYSKANCRWADRHEQMTNRRGPKLSLALVQEIRGRLEHGESQASVAHRMLIDRSFVSLVKSGKRWPEAGAPSR